MILDITPGITITPFYKAWKFPGGEIHFKLEEEILEELFDIGTDPEEAVCIKANLNTAEKIIFFAIVAETIRQDFPNIQILADISYMPYQQADRRFESGECFSLKTICNILNNLPVMLYKVFDPHSDVTPALLNRVVVDDNSSYITDVLNKLHAEKNAVKEGDEQLWNDTNDLVIISPDAGAYKKIFKLCEHIGFKGAIETANKYRDTKTGELHTRLSVNNFNKKDVLIIDDICMGGRTFIELAKSLKQKNVGDIYLAVSHGIFSNGFDELSQYFKTIYTTDSYKSDYPDMGKFLNVFKIEI